jgi:hypothetical protein
MAVEDEIYQSIYYGRPQGNAGSEGCRNSMSFDLVTYIRLPLVLANVPTQSWVTP